MLKSKGVTGLDLVMRKIVRGVPCVLVIVLILMLTMQDVKGTMALSENFRKKVVNLCEEYGIDATDAWWNNSNDFRKIGHVIEYFILGVVVCVMLKNPILSFSVCLLISLVDQVLKIYVPVRHFDVSDLWFDAFGFVIAIVLSVFFRRIVVFVN